MSAELPAEGGLRHAAAREDRRPNLSGDLATVLQAVPMFRRAAVGYDRFQVDTYVQWAEAELATADREREHLLARCLDLQGSLEETRLLLSHSAGGAGFLQVSHRIGAMLAAAADEAESIRTDAAADRSAATAEAEQTIARAEQQLAGAIAEADRLRTAAATEAAGVLDEARRQALELQHQAERVRRKARAEADTRLQSVGVIEQRAEQVRRQAEEAAASALRQARAEVIRMLDVGREQRRRADAEADAVRERLEQAAVARSGSLRAEVAALEARRALLREQAGLPDLGRTEAGPGALDGPASRFTGALFRGRSRSLRTP
jgi:cell division septum initiation protein DivIVA